MNIEDSPLDMNVPPILDLVADSLFAFESTNMTNFSHKDLQRKSNNNFVQSYFYHDGVKQTTTLQSRVGAFLFETAVDQKNPAKSPWLPLKEEPSPDRPNVTKPIPIDQSIWKPLRGKDKTRHNFSNKNRGKTEINLEAIFSSSTDDLLFAASKPHISAEFGNSPKDEFNEEKTNVRMNAITITQPKSRTKKEEASIDNPLYASDGSSDSGMMPRSMVEPLDLELCNNEDIHDQNLTPCRYYAQGFCSRGKACNYLHVQPSPRQNFDDAPKIARPRNKHPPFTSPTRYQNMMIQDCIGQIFNLCKDQHGCRFLQKKLDEGQDSNVTAVVFAEVIDHLVELMVDPFGNYLCQKLLEHCNSQQRLKIVVSVSSDLVSICKNMHGTRAVQKMIDQLSTPDEIYKVTEALKGSVVELIQDLNGNHVIQRCLQKMEPIDNQFIYDAVARHCFQVSTHRHGCCVMQRCIDHGTEQQKIQLITEIQENALWLVQDQFGNYVVQYILDLENISVDVCSLLVPQLLDHIVPLSTQKFSSNVIEKCLKIGSTKTILKICRELISHSKILNPSNYEEDVEDPIFKLLSDPYGNYVVQTALSEAASHCPKEFHKLVAAIRPQLQHLRNTPYIKRIQTKIQSGQRVIQSSKGNNPHKLSQKFFRNSLKSSTIN